jgi:molecular chaperone DnaJ
MRDPYEVLGIQKNATEEEIKKAYKTAARKHHPDANQGDAEAEVRFKEVQSAYDILSDPRKKMLHDNGGSSSMHFRRRSGPVPTGAGFSYEEVMEEFFGGGKFRGRNVTVRLEIELKEVITGCQKHIKIKKRKPCVGCRGEGFTDFKNCNACSGTGFVQTFDAPFEMRHACKSCGGSGKYNIVKCADCAGTGLLPGFYEEELDVNIPAGIDSGMQIRYSGRGEQSVRSGGTPGDVIIFILVKDHSVFTREGPNILVEVPVSYTQLVLGGEIQIPSLAEGILKVKVPAGSQSHTKFRVKGRGLPVGNGMIGDLIATVKTETPKIIDEEYKKVLEQLAELESKNVTPRREQWVKKVAELK